MQDLLKMFEFARKVASAIADGLIEAKAVKDMSDEQLAEYDTAVYEEYLAEGVRRKRLLDAQE